MNKQNAVMYTSIILGFIYTLMPSFIIINYSQDIYSSYLMIINYYVTMVLYLVLYYMLINIGFMFKDGKASKEVVKTYAIINVIYLMLLIIIQLYGRLKLEKIYENYFGQVANAHIIAFIAMILHLIGMDIYEPTNIYEPIQ